MEYLDDDDFLLRPLPNHLFQRDNSAWVYDGLSINPMAKPARKRETINSRLIYNFHPMFRDAGFALLLRQRRRAHEPATVRGRRHPGHRQRRRDDRHGRAHHPAGRRDAGPAAASQRGQVDQGDRRRAAEGAGVHAPRHRDDDGRPRRVLASTRTCPTRCGRSPSPPSATGGDYKVDENDGPVPGRRRGARHRQGPGAARRRSTRWAPQREQWDDGNNFLAVSPGRDLRLRAQHHDQHATCAGEGIEIVTIVGLGARPRPRRPALHDLPDRARRMTRCTQR